MSGGPGAARRVAAGPGGPRRARRPPRATGESQRRTASRPARWPYEAASAAAAPGGEARRAETLRRRQLRRVSAREHPPRAARRAGRQCLGTFNVGLDDHAETVPVIWVRGGRPPSGRRPVDHQKWTGAKRHERAMPGTSKKNPARGGVSLMRFEGCLSGNYRVNERFRSDCRADTPTPAPTRSLPARLVVDVARNPRLLIGKHAFGPVPRCHHVVKIVFVVLLRPEEKASSCRE